MISRVNAKAYTSSSLYFNFNMTDYLSKLLDGAGKLADVVSQERPAKRQKADADEGADFFESLANALHYGIWREVQQKKIDASRVEVEIRLGHIVSGNRRWRAQSSKNRVIALTEAQRAELNLNFRAGADEIFVDGLKELLSPDRFTMEKQPLQRLRFDDTGRRWEVDASGGVVMAETKTRFFRRDAALLSRHYDIRIDGASEIEAQGPVSSSVPDPSAWTMERLKRRTTYTSREFSAWKIDITEVDVKTGPSSRPLGVSTSNNSADSGLQSKREVEVEFEMKNAPMQVWLRETDEAKAGEHTREFAKQLCKLLDLIIAGESENISEIPLPQLSLQAFAEELGRLNDVLKSSYRGFPVAAAASNRSGMFEFLGCMPINLTRRNLMSVQRNSYYLGEKTDGVRYLLYVVRNTDPTASPEEKDKPIAVIIDRAKKVLALHGAVAIGTALGLGTVLDGELVYNRTFKKNVFLVFDVLAIDGRPTLQKNFSERFELVRGQIMGRCGSYMNVRPAPGTIPPTMLVRKAFVKKHQLTSDLIGKLHMEDGNRIFHDTERRHHKSDGIIFQPDAPYTFSRDSDLLKWKWPELRSVDLQVCLTDDTTVRLECGGADGTRIDCTKRGNNHVGLGPFDTQRLLADYDEVRALFGSNHPVIAEVTYNAAIGMWGYFHLRADKREPNFIDTVLGVFVEQAEAISVEELQYKMLSDDEDDFWSQMSKMKADLLAKQLSKGSAGAGAGAR